jgi:hypothetical protein
MTLFQYINQNIECKRQEVKVGLFQCSIMRHYEIYSRFDYYKKAGYDYHNAFLFVTYDYDLNERTIYRIIKQMESEV